MAGIRASLLAQFYRKILSSSWPGSLLHNYPLQVTGDPFHPKKVVVDFCSPNIAKPFHVGNLRSALIGRFLSEICRTAGVDTVTINYLGDWGTQFGILTRGFEEFGNLDKLNGPLGIEHLYDIYVLGNEKAKENPAFLEQSRQRFSELENGDLTLHKFWTVAKTLSSVRFQKDLERLRIRFDTWDPESIYAKASRDLISRLDSEGKLQTLDGATGLYDQDGQFIVLLKSNGSGLYLTRDLAAILDRQERYSADLYLYVVDRSQTQHFRQLKQTLGKVGYGELAKKVLHIPFGRIKGMGSRKGNAVHLDEYWRRGRARALENIRASPNTKIPEEEFGECAEELALSAFITNDLRHPRDVSYKFAFEKSLAMKGKTGLNLQYTHARLCNLMAATELEEKGVLDKVESELDFELIEGAEVLGLWEEFHRFGPSLQLSFGHLESHFFVNYLFDLSHAINRAHGRLRLLDQTERIAFPRFLLFSASRHLLAAGLRLIGLEPQAKI